MSPIEFLITDHQGNVIRRMEIADLALGVAATKARIAKVLFTPTQREIPIRSTVEPVMIDGENGLGTVHAPLEFRLDIGDFALAADVGHRNPPNEDIPGFLATDTEILVVLSDGNGTEGNGPFKAGRETAKAITQALLAQPKNSKSAIDQLRAVLPPTGGAAVLTAYIDRTDSDPDLMIDQAGDVRAIIVKKDGSTEETRDETELNQKFIEGRSMADLRQDPIEFRKMRAKLANSISADPDDGRLHLALRVPVSEIEYALFVSDGVTDNADTETIIDEIQQENDRRVMRGLPKMTAGELCTFVGNKTLDRMYGHLPVNVIDEYPKKDNISVSAFVPSHAEATHDDVVPVSSSVTSALNPSTIAA